jgi:4-hydroxy-2-oxoheptanedioate aldolase
MRVNTVRRRMLEGKPAIGALAVLGSPLAAEIFSLLGFDFVLVDNQHGSWNQDGTISAFRSICLGSAVPMARVQQNDFYAIGSLLDRGALGIVVPLVETVEQARAAGFAVRYPPQGGRSSGAFGAGFHGSDYESWINDEVFLAVQIETKLAVEHAEEIMAVDGIDGCWVGPADLAKSMGVDLSTQEGKEAHESAILKILATCRKAKKIPGIWASAGDAERRIEQGFLFVVVGSDYELLVNGTNRTLRKLKRSH